MIDEPSGEELVGNGAFYSAAEAETAKAMAKAQPDGSCLSPFLRRRLCFMSFCPLAGNASG